MAGETWRQSDGGGVVAGKIAGRGGAPKKVFSETTERRLSGSYISRGLPWPKLRALRGWMPKGKGATH